MAKQKQNKEENPLVGGIILLVCGLIALVAGADYVWVWFDTIEIPLQVAGGVFAAIGAIMTLVGIKAKKTGGEKKDENP